MANLLQCNSLHMPAIREVIIRARSLQERVDGPRRAPEQRERPSEELPPHCSMYHGHPLTSNAFVQAYLPAGFRFEGKKSRSCCYKTRDDLAGTKRTKDDATRSVVAWTWQWWGSLSDAQTGQLATKDRNEAGEPAAKRPCTR